MTATKNEVVFFLGGGGGVFRGGLTFGGDRVSQIGLTCAGGQFGQNGHKLHENYEVNIWCWGSTLG